MSELLEGWVPRGRTAVQDLMSNLGAVAGGALAAKAGPVAAIAAGAVLQLADFAAGPSHPWIQAFVGKPGVGMADAGIGIATYLKIKGAGESASEG